MSTLTVRKPKAILFDIIGTVTKTGFVEKVLYPYVRNNMDTYLSSHWANRVLVRDVELLRAESLQDAGPAIVRPTESADKIRRSVVDYVIRCMDEARNSEALRIFQFHLIFEGYNHNHLKTEVYTDVAIGLGKWSTKENIKLYVFSNGWKYAMRKFLQKTNHEDLSLVVEQFMDTESGQLNDAKSYQAIVAKLGFPAEDILLLTHSGVEGVAAHFAGLSVVLVATHRDELHRERTEETQKAKLPFIRTFTDLVFASDAPAASTMGSHVDYVAPSSHHSGSRTSSATGSNAASGPKPSSSTRVNSSAKSKSKSNSKSSLSAGTKQPSSGSKSKSSSKASDSGSSLTGGSSSKGSKGSSSSASAPGSGSSANGSSSSSASSKGSDNSKSSH